MRQLSGADTVMLLQDAPHAPNQIGPILICDPSTAPGGRVTFTGILKAIDERLHLAPSFRRRLVQVPFGLDHPWWVEDPEFDLEFHVRHIALPKPGDWRQFCIQVARIQARPLDLSRPPWELSVIEGLDHVEGIAPGSYALCFKVHHSAVDGKEGLQLMTALTSVVPDAPFTPATEEWVPEEVPSTLNLLGRSLLKLPARPVAGARLVAKALPEVPSVALGAARMARRGGRKTPIPITRFNGLITSHRVFDSVRFDLDEVLRVKKAAGARTPDGRVTINDMALGVVGGAMRRYLLSKDELPELPLIAAVPISTRTEATEGQGGNAVEGAQVSMHTDLEDDLERLVAIAATTKTIRELGKGISVRHMAAMSELVPGSLMGTALRGGNAMMARVGFSMAANCTITNVPGPRIPLYFLGNRIDMTCATGPLLDGLGLLHVITSYRDDLNVTIFACREMLPDPAFYADCVRDSFAALAASA